MEIQDFILLSLVLLGLAYFLFGKKPPPKNPKMRR